MAASFIGLESRAAFHQQLVRLPVVSGGFLRILRQLGGGTRIFIAGQRTMAEYVAHLVAEAVAQIGDHFVCGAARGAVIAAVLDQSDRRLRVAQRVIEPAIHRRVEAK
jgi:alpha-D-ribose 1-methylphosphonate 5-triphosphate synthase subunit PhnG